MTTNRIADILAAEEDERRVVLTRSAYSFHTDGVPVTATLDAGGAWRPKTPQRPLPSTSHFDEVNCWALPSGDGWESVEGDDDYYVPDYYGGMV